MVAHLLIFLTILILQCSDDDFGRGDVSRDVFHEPGCRVDLSRVLVSKNATLTFALLSSVEKVSTDRVNFICLSLIPVLEPALERTTVLSDSNIM